MIIQTLQDTDCTECYCGWCGRSSDSLSCRSCKTLFCASCIKRNFGEEYLSKVQASGWNCFCCSPSILHKMKLALDEAMKSGVSVVSSSDSEFWFWFWYFRFRRQYSNQVMGIFTLETFVQNVSCFSFALWNLMATCFF